MLNDEFYAVNNFDIIRQYFMLHRATELRNICRNQWEQIQKVHRTEIILIIVSVLCTFYFIFSNFDYKYFAALLLCIMQNISYPNAFKPVTSMPVMSK